MTDDARLRDWRGRALLALSVVFALSSAGLVAVALSDDEGADVVLDVETVVADVTPTTLPPFDGVEAERRSVDPIDVSAADDAAETDTSTGSDDAAEPEPEPEPPEPEARSDADPVPLQLQPVGLTIDGIGVSDPIRAVGLEENGELEIPDVDEIGWYRYGAAPGERGATVLAAHVYWNDRRGPFHKLGRMEPGDLMEVDLADGSVRTYAVVERTMYDKDSLPDDRIWRRTGPETLVLITCGGSFNPEIRRYRQNIVVYAVPVG